MGGRRGVGLAHKDDHLKRIKGRTRMMTCDASSCMCDDCEAASSMRVSWLVGALRPTNPCCVKITARQQSSLAAPSHRRRSARALQRGLHAGGWKLDFSAHHSPRTHLAARVARARGPPLDAVEGVARAAGAAAKERAASRWQAREQVRGHGERGAGCAGSRRGCGAWPCVWGAQDSVRG